LDKRAFIKRVRSWESASVKLALRQEPSFATYKDQIGKTPLHHCAEINPQKFGLKVADSLKTARALLAAGADVNAIRVIIDDGEEFYASPLWYAVAWGKNPDLAHLLLENKARPDHNAVGSAIWDQDFRMAALLHSHGGNIDHEFRGETPLLRTVKAKRLKLLKWLIDNGADINFQDGKGYTALHYAANGNHTLAQAEALLQCGAKPKLKAKDGSTAISLSEAKGKAKLAQLLRSF
jgi:uncharacterized protein